MEMKTETLADVLRDLCHLAPDRFRVVNAVDKSFNIRVGSEAWAWTSFLFDRYDPIGECVAMNACMEECAAREWGVLLSSDYYGFGSYTSILVGLSDQAEAYVDPPGNPALAIATALRGALRNAIKSTGDKNG